MKKILNKISKKILPIIDLAGDKVILLAGSGRSGTTWVQELINHQRDHRMIFEPFWPKQVPFLGQLHFRQYIRANSHSNFQSSAFQIINGNFRNKWADKFANPGIYRKRLIKDIRANLFLKFLHNKKPNMKIVFLMRHPCAVISSRLKKNWLYQQDDLLDFLEQPDLVTDFLTPFVPLIRRTQNQFERHIIIWAIENYVPLKQFCTGEIFLLFYEELLDDPANKLPQLFNFLELAMKPSVFEVFDRPSALAGTYSAIITGEDRLNAWRKRVSSDQIRRTLAILSHFGLDKIYDEDSMPCSEAANCLLEDNRLSNCP